MKTLFRHPVAHGGQTVPSRRSNPIQDLRRRGGRHWLAIHKIRLLTGHLVTLPNDQLAGSDIENIGRRKYIRRKAEIHIPLNTPSEKVEKALAIIREKLANQEGMDPELPPESFLMISAKTLLSSIFLLVHASRLLGFQGIWRKTESGDLPRFRSRGIQFSLPIAALLWTRERDRRRPRMTTHYA